jgi:PAS domain S-box-containing protein
MNANIRAARLDPRYSSLILDSVSQGIFTINASSEITTFNRAAQRITGYRESEVLGRKCSSVFKTNLCDTVCPLRQSIHSREKTRGRKVVIRSKNGLAIPISIATYPLETRTGKLLGGVEVFEDLSSLVALQRKLDGKYRFDDIASKNAEMERIFELLPLVAKSESTVLVTGESGTGKELVAKAIHNHGSRRKGPFVAISCAAMPETLLESELFGYKKGAFTDAKRDKPGRISQANGGTLFLDEIADLARPLQVKLLRFLQERCYEPLGATGTVRADVRVISATNRNLSEMVRQAEFREDLFFRLNVVEIKLPPLRERSEDIPLLAQHFVRRFRTAGRRHIEGIEDDALALLARYPFPGNIRELENIIERAFVICQRSLIDVRSLPDYVRQYRPEGELGVRAGALLETSEAKLIARTLKKHRGNRTRAAEELGIHRVTLFRKIKKYGLS